MRKLFTIGILVLVLVIAPATAGQQAGARDNHPLAPPAGACPDQTVPHQPIRITSDLMFRLGPLVGVTNPLALGTAEDPFVIEGWCIVSGGGLIANATEPLGLSGDRAAITLEGTSAHVVIQGNVVDGAFGDWVSGVEVENADNVTIANNTIVDGNDFGIRVDGINTGGEPLTLPLPLPDPSETTVKITGNEISGHLYGVYAEDGRSIELSSNTIQGNRFVGVSIERFQEVVLQGNYVTGNEIGAKVSQAPGALIEANRIADNPQGDALVMDRVPHARIADNHLVENGDDGIQLTDTPEGVEIVGNTVARNGQLHSSTVSAGTGIVLWDAGSTTVEGNRIADHPEDGLFLVGAGNFTIQGNEIQGNSPHGLDVDGELDDADQRIEATGNWWGAADGPGGGIEDACTGAAADGSGQTIDPVFAEVCFDPWATEPIPEAGAG